MGEVDDTREPDHPTNVYRNTHIYFIDGVGCKFLTETFESIKHSIFQESRVIMNNISIECPSIRSSLYNITRRWIGQRYGKLKRYMSYNKRRKQQNRKQKRIYNSMAKRLFDEILGKLNSGMYVLVYGHSAGGQIAGLIGVLFSEYISENHIDDNMRSQIQRKLQIATFGSIHIPTAIQTDGINIQNYLALGDVALKLNTHLTEPTYDQTQLGDYVYDATPNVTWFRPTSFDRDNKRGVLFGNSNEWEIHDSYSSLMDKLFKNRSNKLPEKINKLQPEELDIRSLDESDEPLLPRRRHSIGGKTRKNRRK